jgi:hypothetical protein
MTQDPVAAAMQRYHDRFDSKLYNTMGEYVASNLNAERDDERVVSLVVAAQNGALDLCHHPDHIGTLHTLAVQCGRTFLSVHTIDAIWRFLRAFNEDDTRLDDFEATTKAMLIAYRALEDLKTATAHANGVHSWQGRMAYDLLAAVELLTYGAITLLARDDETYTHEKLHAGLNRITGALYEGVRNSEQPRLFNFKSVYFPDERDRP